MRRDHDHVEGGAVEQLIVVGVERAVRYAEVLAPRRALLGEHVAAGDEDDAVFGEGGFGVVVAHAAETDDAQAEGAGGHRGAPWRRRW